MKILAVEFSSDQRSVAIADRSGTILGFASEKGGRSAHAIALVEKALLEANLEREAIDCIAIGIGPGSYTGIRASISLAQGWQLGRDVKTLGISSVECLAAQARASGLSGRVNIIVDAQRNEFYIATYEISSTNYLETERLRLAPAAEINERLGRGEVMIGPDAGAVGGTILFPDAKDLAKLASSQTHFVPGEMLEPIYLRETSFVKAPPPRVL